MPIFEPSFTINNEMLSMVSAISQKLGMLSAYKTFESRPYLRRSNRIRSIHSSLAIEANSLSLSEVSDVIDGKKVRGPESEIIEVKNAYKSYELLGSFDPYYLSDLKKLHGVMTKDLVTGSGSFRKGEEGVYRDDECIFIAPPPHLVPQLMKDLFQWIKKNNDSIHPLILSSVFHYEFVFIHPFSDGNGRMARLWQTAILAGWDDVFRYIPLENSIFVRQQEYYEAISSCHVTGTSDGFILFMLNMIDDALSDVLSHIDTDQPDTPLLVQNLLDKMEKNKQYTAVHLMQLVGIKSRSSFSIHYLRPALDGGFIRMTIPEHPTSRMQRYIKN